MVDVKDSEGRTAVEIAIANTHIQDENSCAALLLKHKAHLSD